ncbi:MAG TPA: hypothetical protein VLJ59_02365 [Mycobacteriales bacterium]|nr:hypothetical protein [Mycobacteriales bacterium]
MRGPAGVPRSFKQAVRALATQQGSRAPDGVTVYDELGIYRLLARR